MRTLRIACLLLACVAGCSRSRSENAPDAAPPGPRVETKVIGRVLPGLEPVSRVPSDFAFSVDFDHVAYVAQTGSVLVVDGAKASEEPASGVVYGPVGATFAYEARVRSDAGAWRSVVVSGGARLGEAYADATVPFFLPSGRLGYLARLDAKKKVYVVGDEVLGKAFDDVSPPQISPPTFDRKPAVAPSSDRLAYVARKGDKSFVVVDEKPVGEGWDDIKTIAIAAGDAPPAYEAIAQREGGRQHLVVWGEKRWPVPSNAYVDALVLSPDGTRLVRCLAENGQRVDCWEGDRDLGGWGATFRADGALAYVTPEGVALGDQRFARPDAARFSPERGTSIAWSPDGAHFAYGGNRGYSRVEQGSSARVTLGEEYLVVDGKETVLPRTPVRAGVGPGARHVAWASSDVVTVDGKDVLQAHAETELRFSADGKTLRFGARKGDDLLAVTITLEP